MLLAARWKSWGERIALGLVEQAEADGRVDLVLVGRAQHRVEHRLALVGAAAGDEAELGALGVQGLRAGRRLVGQVRRPVVLALQHLDRQALPAEAVVRRVAQRHGEGVDDVLAGRGGAPGVVAAVAELDVEVHAREGDALRVDARPVEVLLHQDLRGEVGRPAGRRPRAGGRWPSWRPRRAARWTSPWAGGRARGGRGRRAASGSRQRAARQRRGARQGRGVGQRQVAARQQAAGGGRRRRRARDLERLERARVGRLLGALGRLLGLRLVGEALALDGGRRVGVVEGRELLPQRAALLGAEAALERVEQLGLGQLAPAALAEDPADQRGGGEEVGHLPVVGSLRAPDRGVLAGHLGRVQARLGDVLVDARDVAQRVVLQLAAAVAVEVVAEVELALVVGLGVRRERPLLGVHGAVGRRAADEGGAAARGRGGAARR